MPFIYSEQIDDETDIQKISIENV